jgi:hypothetical protein
LKEAISQQAFRSHAGLLVKYEIYILMATDVWEKSKCILYFDALALFKKCLSAAIPMLLPAAAK